MNTMIANVARLHLRQQVELLGGGQVSLDSLWRAWGSPDGHDPRRWSELAAPLLSGFAAYLASVDGDDGDPEVGRLLWVWRGDSKDPWHSGDTMGHEFIAWAYATYLDDSFGHSNARIPDRPRVACFRA